MTGDEKKMVQELLDAESGMSGCMTTNKKQYWWMSFEADDTRSVVWPPPDGILGYWCTGYSYNDDKETPIIVLWAHAESESSAKDLAQKCFPEAANDGTWRFCDAVDDKAPGERFPMKDWMKERYADSMKGGA